MVLGTLALLLVGVVWVSAAVSALYGLVLGLRGLGEGVGLLRLARSSIPEAEAASDELGPARSVALEGTVEAADGDLTSRFTSSPAVVAEYEVERWERGYRWGQWERVHHARESVPFVLDGDGGRVLVEPEDASLLVAEDDVTDVGRGERPPDGIEASLSDTGWRAAPHQRRRYSESVLAPGDDAFVVGPVRREPGAFPDGDVTTVVRADAGTGRFLVSDGNKYSAVFETIAASLVATAFALGGSVALAWLGRVILKVYG